MLEKAVVVFVVACSASYAVSGTFLYRSLKQAGIDSVGKVGIGTFAGTFTNNIFQVILRYNPREFSELVSDSGSEGIHKWAYLSSRLLFLGVLLLVIVRYVY